MDWQLFVFSLATGADLLLLLLLGLQMCCPVSYVGTTCCGPAMGMGAMAGGYGGMAMGGMGRGGMMPAYGGGGGCCGYGGGGMGGGMF